MPGTPRAKQYKQSRAGVIYNKPGVVQWERAVAQAAMVAAGPGYEKMIGEVHLQLYFYFPIPKSRKDLSNYDRHLQDPDLTNLLKACEDGLKKVLFADDNLVAQIDLSKRWVTAGNDGVQVEVWIKTLESYGSTQPDKTKLPEPR